MTDLLAPGDPLGRMLRLASVPRRAVAVTAATSSAALLLASFQQWPPWALVLATLLPWVPIFALDLSWAARQFGALALFFLLVVTQGGHLLEHVAQMTQIHLLGRTGPEARGVIGALDVEWVHFAWNSWVLAALVVLATRFRGNRWLLATLAFAAWHELEHAYLLGVHLATGAQGTPGLLATGGALGGGLPLSRPDLHFGYNLIETALMLLAFAAALRSVKGAAGTAGDQAPRPRSTAPSQAPS
jgi:hypothetical protein